MTAPLDDRLERAMEELRASQAAIAQARLRPSEPVTVSSKDHMVTVTVDARGELTALTFGGERYRRVAPAELAGTIIELLRSARTRAMDEMVDRLSAVFPDDLPLRSIVTGKMDIDTMFAEAVRLAGEPLPGEDWRRHTDLAERKDPNETKRGGNG